MVQKTTELNKKTTEYRFLEKHCTVVELTVCVNCVRFTVFRFLQTEHNKERCVQMQEWREL